MPDNPASAVPSYFSGWSTASRRDKAAQPGIIFTDGKIWGSGVAPLFEYDRLIRSIYTLKYLRDPQLERNIRRSQNRIESYHQLRAAVAKVGGKKELTGKNDIETDISNQCGRLISNAIVYYNSAILSRLLERLEAEGNARGIEALARVSPVAWQHILLNGHYTFQSSDEIIDLDALVARLKLG